MGLTEEMQTRASSRPKPVSVRRMRAYRRRKVVRMKVMRNIIERIFVKSRSILCASPAIGEDNGWTRKQITRAVWRIILLEEAVTETLYP